MLGSLLIGSHKKMSNTPGNLGYLARLIIVDATSLVITLPAILSGFVVVPLWYVWVARELKK